MLRIRVLLAMLAAVVALAGTLVVWAQQPDEAVANGWFYSQTGPGDGTGFAVNDDGGIPMWTDFQNTGGVAQLGYPVSRRWAAGPFTLQAFQKGILQWQPGLGMFFLNTYDTLSQAGFDDWLFAVKTVPKPQEFPQDLGQSFDVVIENHLTLLDQNTAIKTAWFSNANWLGLYGLPVAYQDFGNVRVLRAQRAVFQQWTEATSFVAAGGVVIANGGDEYKEAGLIPSAATVPHAVTESGGTVSPTPAPTPTPIPVPTATPTPTPAPAPTAVPAPTAAAIGSVWNVTTSPLFAQDQIIWIGTASGGVLRSTDAGITFTQVIQGLGNLAINSLVASPLFGTDALALVATNDGVFRSIDGGVTWSATIGLPSGRVGGLVFSPRFSTDSAIYAITDQSGLFRSSDRGVTWSAIATSDLPTTTYLGMTAVDGRGPAIHLFVWTENHVYVSDDRGTTWSTLTDVVSLPSGFKVSAVAVDPEWRNADRLWIGSESDGIWRTTNAGTTYTEVLESPGDRLGKINVIKVSPVVKQDGEIIAGTEKRGVYRSRNPGDPGAALTWLVMSVNLDLSDVRGIAYSNAYNQDRLVFAAGGFQIGFSKTGADDWWTNPTAVGPTS